MNLFWSTRALTDAREDHLTEFFAAALDVCPVFRAAYYSLVIAPFAKANGWSATGIARVETQVSFAGTTCCPDVLFHLTDGKIIACEHKLEAPETPGPERDQRPQLERYLDLRIDGLVYARNGYKPPSQQIINHAKYIRPVDREHFIWRDFYPLLSVEQHVLLAWIREGFDLLGFTPPHPSIGEMSGPDDATKRANRENFAKLWGRTRSFATSLGWKVGAGYIVELYLSENPSSIASWVFISPAKCDRFLFRVTPKEETLDTAKTALETAIPSLRARTELVVCQVPREKGKVTVIDITSSLHELLGTAPLTTDAIESRLLEFTSPLLNALQS